LGVYFVRFADLVWKPMPGASVEDSPTDR
jgi:hypothetical protein